MPNTTASPRVLVIATNYGPERDELLRPVRDLRASGIDVTLAAPSKEPIRTLIADAEPGETIEPDATFDEVNAADYAVLVVPGGTLNADAIRINDRALALVKDFAEAGKPVAAICHGPWLLAEAGLTQGKTLTSYKSIRTDVVNAGGSWVDQELVTDDANGWTLITSRTPNDLDAFIGKIKDVLAQPATK